ncbi:hypothetical protein Srot_0048 [Segniliparus rotundus DSM 44985]|uniref:Uncharacterized protein n=1 Tax=Segniliparus rotundus (strain ATCC BAA-972 / CDC 1076 / CIP 108378 / DSM 44985 / JCM 13578) TaxID=640132 RepID=D6Z9L4_SEGRD|nr:hypothetical protein [Segniliparus rotundus]ADG96541.1 hypothetical protein Srot_0048 [Segniliparus rotundus DSM 44985]
MTDGGLDFGDGVTTAPTQRWAEATTNVSELRDVWGELANHNGRVTDLEAEVESVKAEVRARMLEAAYPSRKSLLAYMRPARWAQLAALFANLALVLWWAVVSCGMGMSPYPGAIVCGIAICAAWIFSVEALFEALDRKGAGE